jgi:DNA invertase Pin-like site-specific DNA recombinase
MIYKYIRFSTDSQDEQQQQHAIDSWLTAHGMTADSTIKDEGVSGGVSYKSRNLLGLVKSLALCDTLVVSEISRITRSGFGELNELIQKYFKPNRLRLVICNVGLDINCSSIDAMTELQLSMLAIFAKMEKELIIGRTNAALNARRELKRKNGGWTSKTGKWCTGFGSPKGRPICEAAHDNSARTRAARVSDDPIRRQQYDLMQNLRARGDTVQAITDTMNTLGYTAPKGGKWQMGQVSRALNEWGKFFN